MKKKLLATVLAMTMALTPMSVQAQEVESMRYTFTAMDNLIVTIPSSLDLTYEYGTFKGQDTVTVQGMKSDTKEYSVDISLDSTDIVYTNQTDGVSTVNGVVSLGENGTESWSADEVASGVSKDISIIVIDTLETEGTYKGAFNYNISVTKTLIDDGYFTMTANEDGTTCTITGLTDTGKAWVVANNGALPIPETRVIENKEYSVTAIGDNAFKENTDIASVTMPNTVESLGVSTFDSCSNLVSCQLSTALTTIPIYCFYACSLADITLHEGITEVQQYAFKGCPIKDLVIPESCNMLRSGSFCANNSLETIKMPVDCVFTDLTTTTETGSVKCPAFYTSCTNLKSVTLTAGQTGVSCELIDTTAKYAPWVYTSNAIDVVVDEGVTTISPRYFLGGKFKSLKIGSTVSSIGDYGCCTEICEDLYWEPESCELALSSFKNFAKDSSNATLHLGDGVRAVPKYLGYGYNSSSNEAGRKGFKHIDWGNSPSITLDTYAFQKCALEEVVIPESVTVIPEGAFYGISATSITVPKSVTSIGKNAFTACSSLNDIYYDAYQATFGGTDNGAIFYNAGSEVCTIHFGDSFVENNIETVPLNLVGNANYYYITQYITKIRYVDWGNWRPTDLSGAFFGSGLYELTIPDSVTSIVAKAFFNSRFMNTIHIPKTLTSIGAAAFGGTGGSNVPIDIVYYAGTETERYSNLSISTDSNSTLLNATWIYEEDGIKDTDIFSITYNDSTCSINGFNSYGKEKIQELNGELVIPSQVIKNGIAYTVTAISSSSFKSNTDIKSVSIADTVTSIGASAFSGCSNLVNVNIPSSVSKISGSAFENCTSLTSVELPDSLTDVGSATTNSEGRQFCGCTSLSSVKLSANMTVISSSMFEGCTSLSSITLPSGVTKIGSYSFKNSGVATIDISDAVTNIYTEAFYASSLTSIAIPENISIDAKAFMNCTSLKTVAMAESVYLVGTTAESDTNGKQFYGCTALTSITIPSGNPIVPGNAFLKCSALTSVTISEGVTTLGWATFAECSKMTDIYIPSTLTTVIKWCFNSDNALKTVHYNGTAESKASISVGSSGNTKFTGAAWEYAVEATTLSLRDEEPVYEIVAFDEPVQMIVTEESTLVSEPEGEITAELQADEILLVYGTVTKDGLETDWLYAENEEEYCGFIDKKFVAEYVPAPVYELVPYDEPIDMIVLDGAVLVDEPEGEVLTELEKDSILQVFGGITIDGLESEWVYTELEDETIGMIKKLYLSEEVETPTPSPSATPTPSETPTPSATPTASETPTPSETPIPSETPTPSAVPTEEPTAEPTQSPEETLIVIEDITNSQQSNESSSSEPVVLQEGGVPLNEDTDIDTSVLDYLPTEEEDLLVDKEIE